MNDQCDSYLPLVPDYCLGLLDPDIAAALEAMLDMCPELQTHVEAYRDLAEPLLHSAPSMQAPPHVFEEMMAATATSASRRWTVRQMPRWTWAAALLVILLVSNVYWLRRNATLNQELNDLARQVETVSTEPAVINQGHQQDALGGEVVSQVPIGIAMNNTTDMSQVNNISAMNPVNQFITRQDNAQAALTWAQGALANTWIGLFYAQNFATQAPDEDYQLWLYDAEDKPRSAGIFDVDAFGNGILVFEIERPIEAYAEIGVTSEPAGGSLTPTGESVLRTPLNAWSSIP